MTNLANHVTHKTHTHVYYVTPDATVRTAVVIDVVAGAPVPKLRICDDETRLVFAYALSAIFADEAAARKFANYRLNRSSFLSSELQADPAGFSERYDLLTDGEAGTLWVNYLRTLTNRVRT